MTTALIRRCDECGDEIPDGRAFVLSRFELQRADGTPAVVAEPLDLCSAECFYTVMRGLFDAAMSSPFAAAADPHPRSIVTSAAARRAN